MKLKPVTRESFLHHFLEQRNKRCLMNAFCGKSTVCLCWDPRQGGMEPQEPCGDPQKHNPMETKQRLANVQKYSFQAGKIYSCFTLSVVKSGHRQNHCIPCRLVREMLILLLSFPHSPPPTSRTCKVSYLSLWSFLKLWESNLKTHLYFRVKTICLCSYFLS